MWRGRSNVDIYTIVCDSDDLVAAAHAATAEDVLAHLGGTANAAQEERVAAARARLTAAERAWWDRYKNNRPPGVITPSVLKMGVSLMEELQKDPGKRLLNLFCRWLELDDEAQIWALIEAGQAFARLLQPGTDASDLWLAMGIHPFLQSDERRLAALDLILKRFHITKKDLNSESRFAVRWSTESNRGEMFRQALRCALLNALDRRNESQRAEIENNNTVCHRPRWPDEPEGFKKSNLFFKPATEWSLGEVHLFFRWWRWETKLALDKDLFELFDAPRLHAVEQTLTAAMSESSSLAEEARYRSLLEEFGQELQPDDRSVLEYGDADVSEVAEATGKTPNAIYQARHRIRVKAKTADLWPSEARKRPKRPPEPAPAPEPESGPCLVVYDRNARIGSLPANLKK
jgi:hypothetical protein